MSDSRTHPTPPLADPAPAVAAQAAAPDACWILSDGKAGTESQCLGLAQALGYRPHWRRLRLTGLFRHIQPRIRLGQRYALSPDSDPIQPPWPQVLITGGRQAVATAIWIKRRAGAALYSIMVQDPRVSPRHFDLVVAPRHDRLRGDNVLETDGSLHRLTPAGLAAARARIVTCGLHGLPRPWLAVLVGGPGGGYRMDPIVAGDLADRLVQLQAATGGSLLVTTSRRTGDDNTAILRARLAPLPGRFITPGQAPAAGDPGLPYEVLLAAADALLVTVDSVTMISEAALTGRPLYLIDLPGGAEKFRMFLGRLTTLGQARVLPAADGAGTLDLTWAPAPLDETARVAGLIRERIARHFAARAGAG